MSGVPTIPRFGAIFALAFLPLAGLAAAMPAAGGPPVTQQVQADFEGLFANDVTLTQTSLGYSQKRRSAEWSASLAWNSYRLDYVPAPFDFLGLRESVDAHRVAGQLGGKIKILDPLAAVFSVGAYDGFTDFRSLWLNQYYRQQFAAFFPEYIRASPKGENGTVGLRWEYLPTVGFLQADVSYLHDEIAPGYEIDFAGLRRGRPNLYTASYHVSAENVLTRRVRLLNEFRLTDTTDREQRYSWQGSLNVALGESWIVRAFGGWTQEDPTFEAWYGGGSVEFEPAPGWHFSVSGRWYRDTGEIENSLFSNAAPGLEAWQVGLGVRRVWGAHSIKVFAAPYQTRYEPFGIGTAFFQNLYKNRSWLAVQLAYSAEF